MSNFERRIRSLCTPAQVYFFISMISILGIISQNAMASDSYRVGMYTVQSPVSNFWFFSMKVIGILIWTFMLNYLCNSGWKDVAWFFVLLPIIVMFLVIGAVMLVLIGQKQGLNARVRTSESKQRVIKRMTVKENLSV
jgi:hypothetical protein